MLMLGQTRRKLGHKVGDWSTEDNAALMAKIGSNQNGDLSRVNFVGYFNRTLPSDPAEFDKHVKEFMHCAHDLRVEKESKSENLHSTTSASKAVVDSVSRAPVQPSSSQKTKLERARNRLNSAK